MDIKNALVQLRDDLKDWVTNNILALRSTIPTKTSELENDNNFITEADIEDKLSGEITSHTHHDMYYTETEVDTKLAGKADLEHGTHLTLGTTSSTAFRGDYGNTAFQHAQSIHAPTDAQKNSDITKDEIEAKFNGEITSHTHNGMYYTETEVDTKLATKADLEHGTHVTFDISSTPKPNGVAAMGTSEKVARADHVHPKQTSIEYADKAGRISTAIDFTIGNCTSLFDCGSDVEYSLEDIGAAPIVHSHSDEYFSKIEINKKIGDIGLDIEHAEEDAKAYAKEYADTKVANLVNSAPEALDTLNELANALGNDSNFATTIATQIGEKANKEHGIHVTFDESSTPQPHGTASNGTSIKVARADHVHPKQTSIEYSNKTGELVNATEFTIGNKTELFNGAGNDDMTFTLSDIGAAPAVHSHSDEYYSKTQVDTAIANKANELTTALTKEIITSSDIDNIIANIDN